jgi:helix-turn-helix protein
MYLYKFYLDFGYGDISGLFLADQKEVDDIIDEYIYFGEVLGKHSQVEGFIRDKDITKIEIPSDVINILYNTFNKKTICGYNPIEYYVNNCND